MKRLSWIAAAAMVLGAASNAEASTGLCDTDSSTTQACIQAIQASGGVINEIFHDTANNDAQHLPTYGKLFNQWGPTCTLTSFAGCAGTDTGAGDCPGQYVCDGGVANTFDNAAAKLAAVDHGWWHPCRFLNSVVDTTTGCLTSFTCLSDGNPDNFNPWESLVFDLGGPSNKVAIFATNDHGPQPCESLEYTVYLSDNPFAKSKIEKPAETGVDPQQWNRAVLSKIYTKGWYDTARADNVACGDTAQYHVEQDSFVQLFSLPCGITFRYASIVAGNDGLDFPECQYASQEAELDAVAGLTESGAGVCPDADGDHYVDCNCPNAPPVCDCDDTDPKVHPGAPEGCDADKDYNCDGKKGTDCPTGLVCFEGRCDEKCGGEVTNCPNHATCKQTDSGRLCVPPDCSGGCPSGTTCSDGQCIPNCDHVVCPGDQACLDGRCVDPCDPDLVKCPAGQTCVAGKCEFPCNCYAGETGCADQPGRVCDKGHSNACVAPMCEGVDCPNGKTCDPDTGNCVDFCNSDVICPVGQKCLSPKGCVGLCEGVDCPNGGSCDSSTGKCDDACAHVTCLPPTVCKKGTCVEGNGSGGGGSSGDGGGQNTGGGVLSGGGDSGGNDAGNTGGCCGVAGEAPDGRGPAALCLIGLGFLVASRRRSRRR